MIGQVRVEGRDIFLDGTLIFHDGKRIDTIDPKFNWRAWVALSEVTNRLDKILGSGKR